MAASPGVRTGDVSMATSPIASFDPLHFSLIPRSHFLLSALQLWEQATAVSLGPGPRAQRESVYGSHSAGLYVTAKALHLIHCEHIQMYIVETEFHYVVQLNQGSLESLCSSGYPMSS